MAEWVRGEVRTLARHELPDAPSRRARCAQVLEQALAEVRRVLSAPHERG